MRLHLKVIAAALSAALVVSAMPAPAAAQQNNQQQRQGVGIWPLLAGAGAASLFTTTSTFHWTTIASKTWSFPWAHGPGKFGFFTGNYLPQGVHATGQYVHNVIDPKYFGETLHISNPHQSSGTHSTSAKYKQQHSKSSKSIQGKIVVGCIFGSALATITSAMRKATAMGNPPRWRSQAEHERILASGYEKQFELTLAEANTAMAFCGLGSFALHWPQQAS